MEVEIFSAFQHKVENISSFDLSCLSVCTWKRWRSQEEDLGCFRNMHKEALSFFEHLDLAA